ncbi:WcbI family polysaccharide biosynthesis putative acetyltransferase [Marisediminicola senii]|uniref:WcbI family polysaccharide biosynthesis putative acetyltransferase n=1 Tax=Marisediminicola senii TaxID=2711233 RepID=UPI0013EAEF03|nr:WcbI family polysaccharide biosynthesis putative acetyltransferase [Marisediminicola senii]
MGEHEETPHFDTVDGRTRHFGQFYGLLPVASDRPVVVVHGNCQAESTRIMLDADDVTAVRIPPVHELVATDLPYLERLLRRTDLLVTQPVRDGYRDLPLGTAELSALLPTTARVVRVPVIRFAGLYPFHAIIRPPSDPSLSPPIAAYHDLRTLVAASAPGTRDPGEQEGVDAASAPTPATRDQVLAIANLSCAELRRREQHHDTVRVSDVFDAPDFAQMRTINHPGNAVWTAVAARVREAAGLEPRDTDPGRPLLDSIHAPRSSAVMEAFDLAGEPTDHWVIGGERVDDAVVRAAHLAWYREHPDAVAAGITRHADSLRLLGLA